jgi:hypothetical protein
MKIASAIFGGFDTPVLHSWIKGKYSASMISFILMREHRARLPFHQEGK